MRRGSITPAQARALAAFVAIQAKTGKPPTVRELCAALGVASTNGAQSLINALVREGCLERLTNRCRRRIRFVTDAVPVHGPDTGPRDQSGRKGGIAKRERARAGLAPETRARVARRREAERGLLGIGDRAAEAARNAELRREKRRARAARAGEERRARAAERAAECAAERAARAARREAKRVERERVRLERMERDAMVRAASREARREARRAEREAQRAAREAERAARSGARAEPRKPAGAQRGARAVPKRAAVPAEPRWCSWCGSGSSKHWRIRESGETFCTVRCGTSYDADLGAELKREILI